jgi:DNA-directed RNA polymerase subunit L
MAQNQAESRLEADHQAKRPLLKNYQLIISQIDQEQDPLQILPQKLQNLLQKLQSLNQVLQNFQLARQID